ncbi:hypothetical protein [Glaesserella parasuis]
MQTAICLFHQRFSTNTQPRWKLAQPFRYLALQYFLHRFSRFDRFLKWV